MATVIQNRRDTATNWTTNNPTLHDGEWGYEKDTDKIKIGDGVTDWNSLGYFGGSGVLADYQLLSEKGVANGYASLDGAGLVPTSQLPSYIDDVLEFADLASFPVTGETGKIYVAIDTNNTYRWSGSAYVELTDSTAIWGDISGTLSNQTDLQNELDLKANYADLATVATTGDHTDLLNIGANTHTQIDSHIASTSNPHSVTASQIGLGNVEDTALSTWIGSTNLTTLGTITTGTWNGTAITNDYLAGISGNKVSLNTTNFDNNLDGTVTNVQLLADAVDELGYWDRDAVNGYVYPTTLTDKVGIGTSTPTARLHTVGAGNASVTFAQRIENSSGTNLLSVRDDGLISFRNYAFPTADGTANQVLTTDGAGNITFQSPTTGVTNHGLLTGLADDDHTQYHNDTRALTWLGTRSTSDLSEGTNLYYTELRVSANTDVAANTAARHAAVTVTDSAEIDFTLTGQDITASLIAGSIDETKLDASVNASLDAADSAVQPGDNISTLTNDTGYISGVTGENIGDLSNVTITTPSDNEVLAYDTTSSEWINQTPTEAGFATVSTSGDHTDLLNIGTNTHAQIDIDLARLADTSGTNTGDQDLSGYQPLLTFDTIPTDGSINPVESNGIFDALALKANTADLATVATSGLHSSLSLDDGTNPHSTTKADVGLGNVENTALSTWTGSTNLTTLGTVTTGTWNGSALTASYVPNHDDLTGFVANEHIDWTNASSDFETAGNIRLSGAANPALTLAEGDSTTSYTKIIDVQPVQTTIEKYTATGISLIDVNPHPMDGVSDSRFRFFRTTNTSGKVSLDVHSGDGTAGTNCSFSGNSNSYLNANAGSVGIGTYASTAKTHIVGAGNTSAPSDNILQLDSSVGEVLKVRGDGYVDLPNTTFTTGNLGIISKNGVPFIHNFNYGNNGVVTTNGFNTFVGENAGNLTMGSTATVAFQASYNTAQGAIALFSNTIGYYNTAQGAFALRDNTIGYYNAAQGALALRFNTTGRSNSAQGVAALRDNTTGHDNTAQGFGAGRYIAGGTALTTTNQSVFVGAKTKALADNSTNEIVIGYDAIGLGSNTAVLGNSSITKTRLQGQVHFKNYSFPTADGTANQVLATDGAGNIDFATVDSSVTSGASGTFTSNDGKTVTVTNGLITDIV